MKNPLFNIGDKVYHITPDSDMGVVIDCIWSMRNRTWTYLTALGFGKDPLLYYEDEISTSKTF